MSGVYSDSKDADSLMFKSEKEKEMYVEMLKIRDLENFDEKGFCINPLHWKMQYASFKKAHNEAKELAKKCDDICIAMVHDEFLGNFVLVENVVKKFKYKFILYNAEITKKENGEVRIYDKEEGEKRPFYNRWIRYKPGSLG